MSDFNQNPFDNGQPNQTESGGLQQPVNPSVQPMGTQHLQQPVNPSVQPMGVQPVNPAIQQPSVSPEMVADLAGTELVNGAEVVKKKSKKGLFIGIAASLAVLVGGSVAAYSFSPWVKNNVKMLINDPNEYYAWVEEENANEIAKELSTAYGSSLDSMKQDAEVELAVELNAENIDKLFEESEGTSITALGIEIPSEVSLKVASKYEKDGLIGTMQLGTDKSEVVTLNLYMIDGVYYYQIPALSSSYIAVDLEELFNAAYSELDSETALTLETYMDLVSDLTDDPSSIKKIISEDDVKSLVLNYSSAVYKSIDDVELEKGVERKVGDAEMEYNVLTAEIDEKCLYDICMTALETAEDDDTVIDICKEFGIDKDTYKDALSSLIDELEDAEVNDSEEYVEMNVYVSSSGLICGREFTFVNAEDEEEGSLIYLVAEEDDKYALEASFNADDVTISIEGDAEAESDKWTGEFVASVKEFEDTIEIPVSFEDIETAGKDDNYVKGEVTVDLSALGVPAITLELDSDGKSQTIKTDIVVAGTEYGAIAYTIREGSTIDVPEFNSSNNVYWFDETGEGLVGYVEEVEANMTSFLNGVGEAFGFEGLGDLIGESADLDSLFGGDTYDDEYYYDDDYYDDYYYDDNFNMGEFDGEGIGDLVDDAYGDDYDDYDDYDDVTTDAAYDFSKLDIKLNGTAVTLPSKIDGILSYVDVTEDTIEPYYISSYYDADYTISVSVENNTEAALAPADCTVSRISVSEGSALDMKINGIGIGDTSMSIESAYGITLDDATDGYITIYDTNSDWNSVTYYWFDGAIYSLEISIYE